MSILGNRELYPGQTVTIDVTLQNDGYVSYLVGYRSPPPEVYSPPVDPIIPDDKNKTTPTPTVTPTPCPSACANDTKCSNNNSAYNSCGCGSQPQPSTCPSCDDKNNTGNVTVTPSPSVIPSPSPSPSPSGYPDDYGGYDCLPVYGGLGVPCGIPSGIFPPPYDIYEWNTDFSGPILATTALGLTCDLSCNGTPMQVISDNHMVLGSLPSGSCSPPLSFTLRVDRNAPAGVYELPMTVTYKYMTDNTGFYSAYGQFMAYNNYVEEVVTVNLIVVVKDMFDLVVSDIWCDNMVPGSEGVIIMKIKNIGSLDVDESVAYLQSSTIGPPQDISNLGYGPLSSPATVDQSMLIPIQNSQFLGRMMAGEEKIVKFKVGISPDAGDGLYPLSVVVSYVDPWGVQMSSNVRTFGVPVEPEMRFSVDAAPIMIKCGKNCVADLTLYNNGTLPAKDAIVRMNALDPFTVGYDTAYLGDIGPGENASTKFSIKVKDDAVPNTYYVTLEVKYYDSNDDPHVTDIIRKPVIVAPPPTLLDTLLENWPLIAGLAIALILALAYFARKIRKNNKANEVKK